ncbi:MAG TPA: SRPBCC domain-containing protein [Streptosporangiaceae bacterium]|nr:SRPBCC domain-containing protein [Streptosporangiaceae bacterium]
MGHEFEVDQEIELHATPDQVWEAIATGPGIDSWFMGRNEIEPREGGMTRMTLGGFAEEGTVTAWEPGRRFAFRSQEDPADGTFMAFEYLIEGRAGGSTVLRLVHSGILGDDWEDQYDALSTGDLMYLRKLATYLKHFPGRVSTYNMFLPGPQVAGKDFVWSAFTEIVGVAETATAGDGGRLAVAGLEPLAVVVEFAERPSYLGVRTADGLYAFIHGYRDTVVAEYHNFSPAVDEKEIERAWQAWLTTTFA